MRIRQILLNLVGNALKFTDKGNVNIEVKLDKIFQENEPTKYKILFAIKDTGIGISPHHRDKLFQPFSQLDSSTNRKYGGTGLGLIISKNLVELLGGKIWLESEENIGSTFYFTIIVSLSTTIKNSIEPSNLSLKLPQSTREKPIINSNDNNTYSEISALKILVAEDNIINQKVTLLTLKKLGYQGDIADNGKAVIEILKQQKYDIILMDMQMPEMDGLETTQWIRNNLPKESQPYIIAVTANALTSDREICLSVGMNDYLTKPIALDLLKQKLTAIDELQIKNQR